MVRTAIVPIKPAPSKTRTQTVGDLTRPIGQFSSSGVAVQSTMFVVSAAGVVDRWCGVDG